MTPAQRQIKAAIASDPIRFIAGRAFMIWLSFQARVKCTGYQLEHYFEPGKIVENESTGLKTRSCKYDRYLQMKSFPSSNTLLAIERKLPNASQLLTKEIWQSLIRNNPDSAYWTQFLRISVCPASCFGIVRPSDLFFVTPHFLTYFSRFSQTFFPLRFAC